MSDHAKVRKSTARDFAVLWSESSLEKPILVGGQAVNFWATLFLLEEPKLKAEQPFTSFDADVVASQDWMVQTASRLNLRYQVYRAGRSSPITGTMELSGGEDGEVHEVQVLRQVNGLTADEIKDGAETVEVDGQVYLVLNPITLLKAKIANVNGLNQRDRQDVKHVRILSLCVPTILEVN